MGPEEAAATCSAILDELERGVVGRRRTLELVLIGVLAGGHVLLEDLPGLGKTLIARSFAKVLGLDFARIQFTPDLLPSDVVGAPLYDQRSAEMVFRPGPVFTQLLLADEINRTPPKTQAALLEAMGEGQVSVDGQTRMLPQPFIVLATDNPIEYEGTYELPEAQLDRFVMRLRLGYLSTGDETDMLRRRVSRATEYAELTAVTSPEGVLAMRDSLEQVEISPDLLDYIVAIVQATRKDAQVQVGASPRGGLALIQLARGQAVLRKRDYVTPDDIKNVAVPALAHRVTLRPELWVRQVSADEVVTKLLVGVPTPKTDPTDSRGHWLMTDSTDSAWSGGRPGTPAGCSRWAWPRCSSRPWPGAPSSRAWPRPRCCCWRPGAASSGRRGSACGPGPAPGGPSRVSWWPSTCWSRGRARVACSGPGMRAGRSSPSVPPRPTGRGPGSSSPRSAGGGGRSAPWTWCCVTAGGWPKAT